MCLFFVANDIQGMFKGILMIRFTIILGINGGYLG